MLHVTVEASQAPGLEGVEAMSTERFCRSRGPKRWIKPFGGRPQIDLDGFSWSGRGWTRDVVESRSYSIAVLAMSG